MHRIWYIENEWRITPREIERKCLLAKERWGKIDLIFIDEFTNVREDDTDYKKPNKAGYERILQELREIAAKFDMPILITARAKRSIGEGIQSIPVDLDKLGLNYRNIDMIWFLQRLDALATKEDLETGKIKNGMSELIIAKSQRVGKSVIPLKFIFQQARFIPRKI